MTISERVYRLILRAYPAEYRREYEEPMLQLWRDQLRHCGGSRRRVALLWGRIGLPMADTLRAAPAMHLETVTGLGGWLMRSRIALAMLASLLFLEVGNDGPCLYSLPDFQPIHALHDEAPAGGFTIPGRTSRWECLA